jgi:hypothetical protein
VVSAPAVAALACSTAALLLPWWTSGVGSTQPPHLLAAQVLAGQFQPVVPRGLGVIFLLPVVAAAIALAALGMARASLRLAGQTMAVLLAALPTASLLTLPDHGPVGSGGWAVASALLLLSIGLFADLLTRLPRRTVRAPDRDGRRCRR